MREASEPVSYTHLEKRLLPVLQKPGKNISSQGDKNRIDEKQVKRPEEKTILSRRQTEPRRTERRHQRRSDRNARNNGRITILARLRHDTGHTAEKGDQHVVSRRSCLLYTSRCV